MASNTPRLNLTAIAAGDQVSAYPTEEAANATILDDAALVKKGTAASRPNPTTVVYGTLFYATDTGDLSWSNATAWASLCQLPASSVGQFATGTKAQRPAAGVVGRHYWATDTTTLFFDNGSAWSPIRTSSGAQVLSFFNGGTGGWQTLGDSVTVTLPTEGLIRVWYQAMWQESVAGASKAAIFIGSNQLTVAQASTGTSQPQAQAAVTNASVSGTGSYQILSSFYGGLVSAGRSTGSTAYTGDVTTGQIVGAACDASNGYVAYSIGATTYTSTNSGIVLGGPCEIFADPGTYLVGIQFHTTSGQTSVTNRRFWVEAVPFQGS